MSNKATKQLTISGNSYGNTNRNEIKSDISHSINDICKKHGIQICTLKDADFSEIDRNFNFKFKIHTLSPNGAKELKGFLSDKKLFDEKSIKFTNKTDNTYKPIKFNDKYKPRKLFCLNSEKITFVEIQNLMSQNYNDILVCLTNSSINKDEFVKKFTNYGLSPEIIVTNNVAYIKNLDSYNINLILLNFECMTNLLNVHTIKKLCFPIQFNTFNNKIDTINIIKMLELCNITYVNDSINESINFDNNLINLMIPYSVILKLIDKLTANISNKFTNFVKHHLNIEKIKITVNFQIKLFHPNSLI
jgi:hypothetical protein